MASDAEAELGVFFENYQKATSVQTSLAEMGNSQTPTLVATLNKASNIIVNVTAKQKISRAIDMIFIGYVIEYEKIMSTYSGKR